MEETLDRPVTHNPKAYLEEYFQELNREYAQLYRFWASSTQRLKSGATALNMGIGPALHSTFPLAAQCGEIHLADSKPENFLETQKWLENQADQFNWDDHIDLVLQIETMLQGDIPSDNPRRTRAIRRRSATTRQAITQLLTWDPQRHLLDEEPRTAAYDVVAAHYCTERGRQTLEDWQDTISHLVALIKPGGFFFLSVARHEKDNTSGHPLENPSALAAQPQHVPNIQPQLVTTTLAQLGFDMDTLWLETIAAPEYKPYSGTILISVQRAAFDVVTP